MFDNITSIIDKDFFDKSVSEMENEIHYLYHYILIELKNNMLIKIDNFNQLESIEKDTIKYKYYCEKIHYYNETNNLLADEGYPIHIYDLGYFMIDGLANISQENQTLLQNMLDNYKLNYDANKYIDSEFLKLNKSINIF